MSTVASPCINICTLDAAGASCLGCGRSVDEITRWAFMSNGERAGIIETLALRRAATIPASLEDTDEA
ncbi:MAG: hypothetical protein JWM36_1830 [Hyphomicrobiales bacterium]|jgi:predicted Fe-S protein YdhL (DUF1289 family)|nr:hypothetical protein [Hyphomicrobiales bacterium]